MEQGTQPGRGRRDLLWKEAPNAPCRILGTKAGPLFLHDHCPAGVVKRLSAERGLHAFARLPEQEYQLLLALAKRPDTKLTLVYTPGRVIVGQVTLVPAAGWWQDLECTYEMSLEVSSSWRRLGMAHQLVARALQDEAIEELIILVVNALRSERILPVSAGSLPPLMSSTAEGLRSSRSTREHLHTSFVNSAREKIGKLKTPLAPAILAREGYVVVG